jgi:Fe2+ transport system protein FeoA
MKEEQKEKNMTETEKRAEERLLKRRQIDSNGCWRYTGASTSNGYGWMTYRGRNEYAHRLAAIIFRPGQQLCVERTSPLGEPAPDLVDGDGRQRVLVHVPPITIIGIASFTVGGDRRADRPQSRQLPGSYQVTLGGLGTAAATQHWQVSSRATCGNRVSRRRPSLRRLADATTRRE